MMPTAVSAAAGVTVVDRTGDGEWTNNTWQVSMYSGETKATTIKLYNSSSSSLEVEVSVLPDSLDGGNLTFELDKTNFTMPGRSYADITLTVKASDSTTPGTYTTELEIKYEVPPTPSRPTPSEPTVVEPEEEEPTEPEEPELVEPEPEEPEVVEPEVVEPVEEPEEEEPEVEEPEVVEPEVEEPEVIEPGEEEEEVIVLPAKPGTPWGLIGGIVGGLAATGGVGYWLWLWRRRRRKENYGN